MEEFIFYIKQGFFHVLDYYALDHILFFIALTIVYGFKNWNKALWVITLFTLGHSLTFGLASYNMLSINKVLVEFLIPITILIPLVLHVNKMIKEDYHINNTSIYFAFFFGLIHGLGFSNYFSMLLDEGEDKLIPLLKFALGIEFAQLVIVLLVLSLSHIAIYSIQIKKKFWVVGVSCLVAFRIIPMLIDRFPF